jgi:hypothetical protein
VTIPKKSFPVSSASATTFPAIATTRSCARDLRMESASAEPANASTDGKEMLATAARRRKTAWRQTDKNVQVMESAFVVAASVKSQTT